MKSLLRALMLIIVVVFALSSVPIVAQEAPTFTPATCMFEIPPERTVECGYLTVPAARDTSGNAIPEAGTMRLAVAIFRSENPNHAADPVVYLEGGPGGDALELLSLSFEQNFSPFLEDRDVIFFDQRGTGYSQPALACQNFTDWSNRSLSDMRPMAEILPNAINQLRDCRGRLQLSGVDFSQFNTRESAQDLDDLRIALGYEQWNLLGISYGTRLAQTALRDTPQGIRSVILDSAYPLEIDLFSSSPSSAQGALNTLFDLCAADPACSTAYPDLEYYFWDTVYWLDESPVLERITHPLTEQVFNILYTGDTLINLIFQSLYSTDLIPLIPAVITDVSYGEFETANLIYGGMLVGGDVVSIGQTVAVQCHDEFGFGGEILTPTEVEPRLQEFMDATVTLSPVSMTALCEFWGAGTGEANENQPVTSTTPTLILAGQLDPITPPHFNERVASNYVNGYLYAFQGVGHGVSVSNECAMSIARTFLSDPSHQPDSTCISDVQLMFYADTREPGEIVLAPFEDPFYDLEGVMPDDWYDWGNGWYIAYEDPTRTLVIQGIAGFQSDALITLLESELGWDIGTSIGTFQGQTFFYTLYDGRAEDGLKLTVAIAEGVTGSWYVALISSSEDHYELTESVLEPVLYALRPGD